MELETGGFGRLLHGNNIFGEGVGLDLEGQGGSAGDAGDAHIGTMFGSGEDYKVGYAQGSCDRDEISQTVVFTFLKIELVIEERKKKLARYWWDCSVLALFFFPITIKELKGGLTLSLVAVLGSMRRRISLTSPMTECPTSPERMTKVFGVLTALGFSPSSTFLCVLFFLRYFGFSRV